MTDGYVYGICERCGGNMIGILLVTHADLGAGFIDAATLIAGKQPKVKAIGLKHGDGVDEFEAKVYQALKELNDGDGVLGFCDFLGGTPSNTLLRCMKKSFFPCITGINMSMLIEALLTREHISLYELEKKCISSGKDGISSLQDVFKQMAEADENEQEEI